MEVSTMLTIPVSFSALQTTVKTYEQSLVNDHQFATAIVGADRCAIIGALGHLEKLLSKVTKLEPNGYRPAIADVPRLALINTIFSMACAFIASVQAIEFSDNNNMERLVGGLLSMARSISDLERDVDVTTAKETIVEKTTIDPVGQKPTKVVRKRGS